MRKQPFFHHILGAARSERRAAVLLLRRQLLAEPGHRAIKVMQREPLKAADLVVLAPAIRRAVGAADK